MENDLYTPDAVNAIVSLAEQILAGSRIGRSVESAQVILVQMCQILGLQLDTGPELRVIDGWNEHLRRFPLKATQKE